MSRLNLFWNEIAVLLIVSIRHLFEIFYPMHLLKCGYKDEHFACSATEFCLALEWIVS